MTENVEIARLWHKFHNLSEDNKDLILVIANAIGYSTHKILLIPEKSNDMGKKREKKEKKHK